MSSYAILDIETTGGKFNEEAITEIAIYQFDGHEVTDQFISLVNPEKEIQPFVVNLTGINNGMLKNAPKFYEVAKRIVEITEGCTLVAHNANFDYRILRTEFNRLGYTYERKTLCTVELSKALIPDRESYSLGKLVRSLGIPVTDRHRASGDALATVKLFKLLLSKDLEKTIIQQHLKTSTKKQLSPKLIDIVSHLPEKTGVYYIHDDNGNILFISKSQNIKKRVNQHFIKTNKKAKFIQKNVNSVTFDITGSELIASLKEIEEIKKNTPKLNRYIRKNYTLALYSFKDDNGYLNLNLDKIDNRKKPISVFTNLQSGKSFVDRLRKQYGLSSRLIHIKASKTLLKTTVTDVDKAQINAYNASINAIIDKYSVNKKSIILIDKGRAVDEKSVILIKNGNLVGFGFFNLNYQITNLEVLESLITPIENSKDNQYTVLSYLRKNKHLKTIRL